MATEEFAEAGGLTVTGGITIHAIFAVIVTSITGFLLHEGVGVCLDLRAKFRMVLQIRLQRWMVVHEFFVIYERRILAELLGCFAVAIQKLIEVRQFLAVDVAIAIVLTAIIPSLLMHEGIRVLF